MKPTLPLFVTALVCVCIFARAAEPKTIPLWPGRAPGETVELPPELNVTKPTDRQPAGRPAVRIGNISNPTITIYSPDPARDTGAAVLVCPGGGYVRLTIDLEGSEVCAWLNSIGVTGILLKYRVPQREGLPQHVPPVQDAQRALGLVRHQAKALGLDPQRIGVLGFSAGAHVAAVLSNNYEVRTYPVIDDADQTSCRPDFVILLYPGYLTQKDNSIAPELKVGAKTPPTLIVQTQDDPVRVENAVYYYLALKQANVPTEMHLYPTGGHGYGLRRTEARVSSWPDRMTDWMKTSGWLKAAN